MSVHTIKSSDPLMMPASKSETNVDVEVAPDEVNAATALEDVQRHRHRRLHSKTPIIMLALCTAVFIAALDTTIITTAAPTIARSLGASSSGYSWIGSSYMLANAASVPFWGKISDVFGRKAILTVANLVFLAGSLVAALANDLAVLLVGRTVQGLGGGGLIILANIAISDLFDIRERGMYLSMVGAVWALAGSLGPIVGGAISERTTWRWCFWINFFFGGVALVLVIFFLKIHHHRTSLMQGLKAIDWLGAIFIMGATLMILLGLDFGGVMYPWSSAVVICLIVFGFCALGLFIGTQWKLSPSPLMPLGLFRHPSNLAALGVCFCQGFGYIASLYYLPLYFQAVLGKSPLYSGLYILPYAILLAVTNVAVGFVIRKTGHYVSMIRISLVIQTLAFGLFISYPAYISWPRIIMFQLVMGLGIGGNFQPPLIALQTRLDKKDIGTGTATFGFIRILSLAVSIVIGQVVFQSQVQTQAPQLLDVGIPPASVQAFSSGDVLTSLGTISSLNPLQQDTVHEALTFGLSRIWILNTAISGLGIVFSLAIASNRLASQTKTDSGIATEGKGKEAFEDTASSEE